MSVTMTTFIFIIKAKFLFKYLSFISLKLRKS